MIRTCLELCLVRDHSVSLQLSMVNTLQFKVMGAGVGGKDQVLGRGHEESHQGQQLLVQHSSGPAINNCTLLSSYAGYKIYS